MNSIQKFQPSYALEIISPKYGTAYRIGGRLVLTCAHLFGDNKDCELRSKLTFGVTPAEVIWKAPEPIDIALIKLPETIETCPPVCFGKLPDSSSAEKVKFDFFGWPQWGFISSGSETKATGLHIEGIIYVADISPNGLLVLEVERTPSILEIEQASLKGKSPWQGTSGAAIICNGLVVGVQRWHQNSDRPESLEAESLEKVYSDETWYNLLRKNGIDPELKPVKSYKKKVSRILDYLPRSGIPQFVGREKALDKLHQQLQESERIAISTLTGMGGIGKTELALQYALNDRNKDLENCSYKSGICWINVSDKGNVGTQILNFAKKHFKIPMLEEGELEDRVKQCWQYWGEEDSLIIFDDVRKYRQIKDFLPPQQKRFKVIITTRKQKIARNIKFFTVEVLSEQAALDLISSFIGKERVDNELEESKELCQELGYLPLGLELIARLLDFYSNWSINEMRQVLEDNKKLVAEEKNIEEDIKEDIDEAILEMTAQKGMRAAFEITWKELESEAQELASYLSLFEVAPINYDLIKNLFSLKDERHINNILERKLVNLSLIKDSGNQIYEIHTLIHQYLREKLEASELAIVAKKAYCQLMVSVSKQIPEQPVKTDIEALTSIIPHLSVVAKELNEWINDEDLIWPYVGISGNPGNVKSTET